MEASSPRWTTVSDSPHDHEREALAFLRRHLPDRDPYRVWSNFSFTAPGGNLYEVDALAVTDNGVHLIEIKSHPGTIGGDAATWQWTPPEDPRRRRTFDNPRLLANRKAKALRELLERSKAFTRHRSQVPYVSEVVFLSDPDLRVALSPPGRHQVFGRDNEDGSELPVARRSIGGIVAALTGLDPVPNGRPRRRLDRPTGARVAEAMEEAGIRERTSRRRFGDYRLVELLADVDADRDTGVGYQDFLVEHAAIPDLHRRLRLYPLELNATTEQREAASRAAKREFQLLHALDHPGILAPVDFFEHERGPCLLFDHDPDAVPLDKWLLDPPADVDVLDRLDLVRQATEALAHAHGRGVFHRALCPSAVLVDRRHDALRLRLTNWHAGARVGTGDAAGSVTGTEHVDALAGGDAPLYRAPEHALALADPAPLDLFSLGCLTTALFTGGPPAPTPGTLRDLLATAGHVPVEAVGDGVDDGVGDLVALLTMSDPADRASLADVLAHLDTVEEEWTHPDPADDEPHVVNARKGATLGGGRFQVVGRFGLGSTAFTLLVRDTSTDGDRLAVLKVARTPDLNPRITAEATALAAVEHHRIVKLLDGPLDLDGHAALLLSYAGARDDAERDLAAVDSNNRAPLTLAARIGERLDAEVTERLGKDLLDLVRHLEDVGVAHRDLKPENLALAPRGKDDALHLVLFDFSLAGAPLDRLDVGTPGYVDPFLGRGPRTRWDPAAERYAAAVVLHELCTGTRPVYGDGKADPALVDAPLRLDPELFDASVADGLFTFFSRALAPDAADRHGSAEEMQWAWHQAFHAGRQPASPSVHPPETATQGDEPPPFEVPPGTTVATPLSGLPLSARAVAALERLEILTVGDLLGEPLNRLRQVRGFGAAVRNELVGAVAQLRETLAEAADIDDDAPLEVVARALVSRTAPPATVRLLRAWLGLDGGERWPTIDDLASDHGGRERVSEALAAARERWGKRLPAVTAVRTWIAGELEAMGGLATAEQLAARLAQARPAPDPGLVGLDGEHERAARAVVRAAVALELERAGARWVRRVLDGPVVVALDPPDGPPGNRLADWAAALAARTAELVTAGAEAVVSRGVLVGALRQLEPPDGARALGDAALAELAASLCPLAAVNSRLELYRRDLGAADALRAARRAFVAVQQVTPAEVADKVAARFPAAERLPPRPHLDALVAAAGLDLRWDPVAAAYLPPPLPASASTSTSSSLLSRHTGGHPPAPVEIDVAADFDDRLHRSLGSGGLLVLAADPRRLEWAAAELARFPVTTVDVDAWLVAELRRLTEGGRPSWDLVVQADAAGPGAASWHNLTRVVDRALDALSAHLAATPGTVLLTRAGLLARYRRLDLVARWRDLLHDPATPLAGLWLLVGSRGTTDVPLLDGEAVPVLTRNEWARVPGDWLKGPARSTGRAPAPA